MEALLATKGVGWTHGTPRALNKAAARGNFQMSTCASHLSGSFTYCAVASLALLGALDEATSARTVAYLASCQNHDGGFCLMPGSESHAGG
jgi:prenyltransferase beta subunit